MDEKVYTPREVANILNVSVFTVQELLRSGKIKGFKITSRWRVKPEELNRFVESQEVIIEKEEN